MKETIVKITNSLSIFAAMYLLTSFVQASFDISAWHPDARKITAVIGGVSALITFAYSGNFLNKK